MSNEDANIFDEFFDSYGLALDKYLKHKDLSKKWLAKEILPEGVKLSSVQSQISRWVKGEPVGEDYRERINKALDITIKQNSEGKWVIEKGYRSQVFDKPAAFGDQEPRFRLNLEDSDITEEPSLDDLPRLIRLRDKLDEKIRKLVNRGSD